MAPVIKVARELLETSSIASEISVPAGHVFSAKSKVRELIETATGDVFIVDPYVGVGMLDCLRNITGFDRMLSAFQGEGHQVQARRANQLHDRHIILNDRCWLAGGSL